MIGVIRLLAAASGGSCSTTAINTCSLPTPTGTGTTAYLNMVLTIVFGVAASVAVLLIVVNGFRYIIARGDPGATASAKDGMIYSLVGLLIVMLAYSIVVFVAGRVG